MAAAPAVRSQDIYNFRIVVSPLRPGRWRYQVYKLEFKNDVSVRGPLYCDRETVTQLNAWFRAWEVVRLARKRPA